MIYSVGCEYAIRAMVRLAAAGPAGRFVLLRDLVGPDRMPSHFVGKVLQSLVRADLLVSAKGRGGGFALGKSASQITLRDVVEAVDGPARLSRCILGFATCDDTQPCPQHDEWAEVRRRILEMLDRTTIADLNARLSRKQHRPLVNLR